MFDDIRAAWNIAKTLHKKSSRDETGLFLIEGHREIGLARENGIEILQIFDKSNTSAKNLERITYCGQIAALAKIPHRSLLDFTPPEARPGQTAENPLIVVLDRIEKPGNIGAVIRTADAAGVTAVIISDAATDLGNPNLIRASLGAIFSLPVFFASSTDAVNWLEQSNIPVVAATPEAEKRYFEHDFTNASAIVLGNEAEGVSKIWSDKAISSVTIPMSGAVNSLNVSVSAAILIYEAVSKRLLSRTC